MQVSKYDEMSDAKIEYLVKEVVYGHNDKDINRLFHGGRMRFCNNPNDAWPIIVENEIDLISPVSNGTSEWQAVKFEPIGLGREVLNCHKSPLRAAMIVFLMMKDGE